VDVIFLERVNIIEAGKEQTSKRNAFMITSGRNRIGIFVPDTDVSSWVSCLRESCKEFATEADVSIHLHVFILLNLTSSILY
jgi:hypothetical protein